MLNVEQRIPNIERFHSLFILLYSIFDILPGCTMARIIKRHANRRLYDTEDKRTVTLDDLSALVKRQIEIQVIDRRTGEDLTVSTLSQILAAESKGGECGFLSNILHYLIRRRGNSMLDLIKKAMLVGIGAADLVRERVEALADELIKRGQMAEGDRVRFVREMTDKMVHAAEGLKGRIDEGVEKMAGKMQASKLRDEEIARLRQQIEDLSQQLEELKAISNKGSSEQPV